MNKQQEAFDKLSKLKCGALFSAMGTGKTKIAIDLINSKYKKIDYVVWFSPISIIENTKKEFEKWGCDVEVHFVGIESISQSDRIYIETLELYLNKKVFTVVDESLKIKNTSAKRTQRMLKIGELSKYRIILNGTPVSKSIMDIWSQMEFLSPKILKMSENEFKNTFCEYYIRGRLKGMIKKVYNVPYLISLINPYIFDSQLDLDKGKNYYSHNYEMDDREVYEEIKIRHLKMFYQSSDLDFFSLSTELQQCFTDSEMRKQKLEELLKTLDKAIIYVKYLKNIPQNAISITGKTTQNERKDILDRFEKGEIKFLYMTYGIGAYGLNLQHCSNTIFLDHTFDYAERIQAEARTYRMGQNNDVNYYDFKCNCGLERMIEKSQNKKSNLLKEMKLEIDKKGVESWLKYI